MGEYCSGIGDRLLCESLAVLEALRTVTEFMLLVHPEDIGYLVTALEK